jgi:hypothetical protein
MKIFTIFQAKYLRESWQVILLPKIKKTPLTKLVLLFYLHPFLFQSVFKVVVKTTGAAIY